VIFSVNVHCIEQGFNAEAEKEPCTEFSVGNPLEYIIDGSYGIK